MKVYVYCSTHCNKDELQVIKSFLNWQGIYYQVIPFTETIDMHHIFVKMNSGIVIRIENVYCNGFKQMYNKLEDIGFLRLV